MLQSYSSKTPKMKLTMQLKLMSFQQLLRCSSCLQNALLSGWLKWKTLISEDYQVKTSVPSGRFLMASKSKKISRISLKGWQSAIQSLELQFKRFKIMNGWKENISTIMNSWKNYRADSKLLRKLEKLFKPKNSKGNAIHLNPCLMMMQSLMKHSKKREW